jgi:dGTPase
MHKHCAFSHAWKRRQTVQRRNEAIDFVEFGPKGEDLRAGLNLCFRTLAGVLKYDKPIPRVSEGEDLLKGYYASEARLVDRIKRAVLAEHYDRFRDSFAVVEMQIMDLADDIAYSTYDFEDALKAGFASPLELVMQLNSNEEIRYAVATKLFKSEVKRDYPKENPAEEDKARFAEIQKRMSLAVFNVLKNYFHEADQSLKESDRRALNDPDPLKRAIAVSILAVNLQKLSTRIAQNGYLRALLTSDLVGKRIRAVTIEVNEQLPALSRIDIPLGVRFEIDVMKHLTYELHIKSPRLKLLEYRGKQIVSDLFGCFDDDKEGELLPNDWRDRLRGIRRSDDRGEMRQRLICDYIAGMTDDYALDVYSRLKTTNPAALFRPS